MTISLYSQLQTAFPNLVFTSGAPLAPFTYMKVGGPAEVLWRTDSMTDLVSVLRWCAKESVVVTLLGGASNVVISDSGISGLVVINECKQTQLLSPQDPFWQSLPDHLRSVQAGTFAFLAETGIKTALLVRETVDHQLTGLEPFLGVPGTLGGAIFNNAHYTSELIGNFVWAVEAMDQSGNVRWLSQSECQFGYDSSRFHQTKEYILRVIFALPAGETARSMQLIAEATQKRASTQPLGTANSGCMFKNVEIPPEKRGEYDGKESLSAGWLIDQAGLKNTRVGNAIVSEKHANFIINEGNASATDVQTLVNHIQEVVKERFGVDLVPEVFFLGTSEAPQKEESHA